MKIYTTLGATMVAISSPADAGVQVAANSSGYTLLDEFDAGTYAFATTGIVSLAGPVGSGFDIDADGTPVGLVAFPKYDYFNPSGADYDRGRFGPGGAGVNWADL